MATGCLHHFACRYRVCKLRGTFRVCLQDRARAWMMGEFCGVRHRRTLRSWQLRHMIGLWSEISSETLRPSFSDASLSLLRHPGENTSAGSLAPKDSDTPGNRGKPRERPPQSVQFAVSLDRFSPLQFPLQRSWQVPAVIDWLQNAFACPARLDVPNTLSSWVATTLHPSLHPFVSSFFETSPPPSLQLAARSCRSFPTRRLVFTLCKSDTT